MQWKGRRQSSNVQNGGRGVKKGVAIGGSGLLLGLLVFLLTGNPLAALNIGLQSGGSQQIQQESITLTRQEKELYDYSRVVLADTEDAWHAILSDYGKTYHEPKMVVFQENVKSGCGIASSGVGPFYCGTDNAIYIDLSFYNTLIRDFQVKEGDFILSYVISHEVGHHIQNELGILNKVHSQQRRLNQENANTLSVRLELQADYLAGVVARYQDQNGYLDTGDVEEAIRTAWAIGDDTIQKKYQGQVQPENFTHGTGEQRIRWFQLGYQTGDLSNYNTFDTDRYPTIRDL
ncbi:MAG: neutral zinc metallopeptidase [Peptoniphilaceae bacterium]|nr:neutral zinc metallopeptidase [Peptoniphilaceae bacterium]